MVRRTPPLFGHQQFETEQVAFAHDAVFDQWLGQRTGNQLIDLLAWVAQPDRMAMPPASKGKLKRAQEPH
jgi:hypothetical protein